MAGNNFGTAATQTFTITITPPVADDSPTLPWWGLALLGALLFFVATRRTPARTLSREPPPEKAVPGNRSAR